VWPFGKAETLEDAAPIAEPVVDRVEHALQRVRELKSALDALDAEMLAFKSQNKITTDRFGRLLGLRCAELNGRAAIEREWRTLLRRRDGLVAGWHKALFDWSQAKEASK
jgi:hypothetical protein